MQRFFLRFFIILLILLLTVGSGLAFWLSQFDPRQIRNELTALLSESSGYQISVQGPLEVQVFPFPRLRASDVTLQSPQQMQPPVAHADSVLISIDVASSLLRRELVLGTALLSGVQIKLVRELHGTPNWSPEQQAEPATQAAGSGIPALLPQTLEIKGLALSFDDQQTGRAFHLQLLSGELDYVAPGDPLKFAFHAFVKEESLRLDGSLAWPDLEAARPFEFKFQAKLGASAARMDVKGSTPQLDRLAGLDLHFEVSSTDPDALIRRWADPSPSTWLNLLGPLDFKGRLVASSGGALSLKEAQLNVGRPDNLRMKVSGDVHNLDSTQDLELDVELNTPSLTKAIQLLEPTLGRVGRTRLTGQVRGQANAPEAKGLVVQIDAGEGLAVSLTGDLKRQEGEWFVQTDFRVQATETERLVNFVTEFAGKSAGPLGPLREQINRLPIGKKFLSLKPLLLTGRLGGSGATWKLSEFKGRAGTPPGDHLDVSGGIESLWPAPSGYEFKAQTEVTLPGPLPGFPENRIERIRAEATYRRKDARDFGRLEDIDFRITGEAGAEVRGQGFLTLTEESRLDSGRLDFELSAPSLHPLARLGQVSLPEWGPVVLNGRVEGDVDRMSFALNSGKIGQTRLSGIGSLDLSVPDPTVRLKLNADQLHLKALREITQASGSDGKHTAAQPSAKHAAAGSSLILTRPRLAWLSETAGEVEVAIDRFVLGPDWFLENLDFAVDWGRGQLDGPTGRSRVGAEGGEVAFKSQLDARQSPPDLKLGFRGDDLPLASLVKWMGYPDAATGRFLLALDLTSQGADLTSIISHLDGRLLLDVGKGSVASKYVDRISLSLVPTHQKKQVPMECLIAHLKAEKGVVRSETFLWRSGPAQLRGAGVINWPEESLDIVLRPHIEKILSPKVTAAIHIKGPFKDPRIVPEPLQTATDLVRGVLGRTLGLVSEVSPQLSNAVTQIGGETNKVLSASGIDNKVLLSLLAQPVNCKKIRSSKAIQAASEYDPLEGLPKGAEASPNP
ncbi:MAG: AsmA family protein [Myxococcota bacterium]|nr:AsmA family protein [Myxococcota bacterium]